MTNKLYILCGIPFAGKSTIAKKIIETKKFTHIDLDQIKFELFGSAIRDNDLEQSSWGLHLQRNVSSHRTWSKKRSNYHPRHW